MKSLDVAMIIITFTICSVILIAIIENVWKGQEFTPQAMEIVGEQLQALTHIIALWVGTKLKPN